MTGSPRLALFVPTLFGGGAERVMVNLARGLVDRGYPVDLVLVRATGPYVQDVPAAVRVVTLARRGVARSIPALAGYLRRERPASLLATLNHANVAAIVAARFAGTGARIVVRQSNTLGRGSPGSVSGQLLPWLVRRTYRYADAVVSVSAGVGDDLVAHGIPRALVRTIPNPVVTPEVLAGARQRPSHPWFAEVGRPVIVGCGRLIAQKDFATLIRAFARVRETVPARLMILGEGPDRDALTQLVAELGLTGDVLLPGFVDAPYGHFAAARLFVLSSAWEGLPGALIQALACGTPAVATDCPSGPREILQGGRFGPLVPVGDVAALAQAMVSCLQAPRHTPPPEVWGPYSLAAAVDQYLQLLLPRNP